jgi:hypothetical protein
VQHPHPRPTPGARSRRPTPANLCPAGWASEPTWDGDGRGSWTGNRAALVLSLTPVALPSPS